MLAAVQVCVPPLDATFPTGSLTLLRTPVVELLISKKKRLLQVLEDAKYDKIPAVRQAAAAALVEVGHLPDATGGEGGMEDTGAIAGEGGASPESQMSTGKSCLRQQRLIGPNSARSTAASRRGGRRSVESSIRNSRRYTGGGAQDDGAYGTHTSSSGRLSAR
jgi:hypothetical protein